MTILEYELLRRILLTKAVPNEPVPPVINIFGFKIFPFKE
jgi:hypothetical protein